MRSPALEKAYQEGRAAVFKKSSDCPYISGQQVLEAWVEGVVDAVVKESDIPPGIDGATRGRCFFKLGIWPPDRGFAGICREFRGYLTQRDIQRART